MNGMVTEPYNDTTEGAVVYYHCDIPTSDERSMIMCENSGKWSPQPQSKYLKVYPFACINTFYVYRHCELHTATNS